jgi:hypothetical protein
MATAHAITITQMGKAHFRLNHPRSRAGAAKDEATAGVSESGALCGLVYS